MVRMDALRIDLKEAAKENDSYRKVLFTGAFSQLVVMSLAEGEEIGLEKHDVDQFIYVVDGEGTGMLEGSEEELEKGDAICVPAGTWHNVVNGGDEPMKLITVYSPPEHAAGLVEEEKGDRDAVNDLTTGAARSASLLPGDGSARKA
jgi:mannose-6-phosphate isomerase-like protein (cupin superfamily)